MQQIEAPRRENSFPDHVAQFFVQRGLELSIQLTTLQQSIHDQTAILAQQRRASRFWTKSYWQRLHTISSIAKTEQECNKIQFEKDASTHILSELL